MSISTVTSKGQITIPSEIRHLLNIKTGDVLEFLVEPDGQIKLYPQNNDISALKGVLPKPSRTVSVEEMNAIISRRGGEQSE